MYTTVNKNTFTGHLYQVFQIQIYIKLGYVDVDGICTTTLLALYTVLLFSCLVTLDLPDTLLHRLEHSSLLTYISTCGDRAMMRNTWRAKCDISSDL